MGFGFIIWLYLNLFVHCKCICHKAFEYLLQFFLLIIFGRLWTYVNYCHAFPRAFFSRRELITDHLVPPSAIKIYTNASCPHTWPPQYTNIKFNVGQNFISGSVFWLHFWWCFCFKNPFSFFPWLLLIRNLILWELSGVIEIGVW